MQKIKVVVVDGSRKQSVGQQMAIERVDDDHCKPFSIKDKILLGASAMFWVWLIIEMVGA